MSGASRPIRLGAVAALASGLALAVWAPVTPSATLWSLPESYLGTGYFFGPGAYRVPTPLFPAMIRGLGFTSDRDFVTPFWNNEGERPNVRGESDFPPVDGRLSDGTRINENVDLGTLTLAGTRFLPAVVEGGELGGQQFAVTMADGNLMMTMDLVLDLGIGPRGMIRFPFYGTTGTLTVPKPLTGSGGTPGVAQAGPLRTGETIAGRIGDFNGDGFIDGTLVAVGVMPSNSPVFPGQPWAMSRNFETDIPIDGALSGSPQAMDQAYGRDSDEGAGR